MRFFYMLPLVAMVGCLAGTHRVATPEVEWNSFQSEGIEISAPLGWSKTEEFSEAFLQSSKNASSIVLKNTNGNVIVVTHPRSSELDFRSDFMAGHLLFGMMADALVRDPRLRERLQIESFTVGEIQPLGDGDRLSAVYRMIFVEKGGTRIETSNLYLVLRPPDESSAFIVATNVPPAEGELFPAEVLAIVRTVRYNPPAEPEE